MKGTKATALVVAIAGLALVFSGCFGFAGLRFSKTKLSPGPAKKSQTIAKIDSTVVMNNAQKEDNGFPNRDYPFFLVSLPSDGSVVLGPASKRRFDVKGVFGPRGGRNLVLDSDLRDAALDGGFCGDADLPEGDYRALRTTSRVNDQGRLGARVTSTIPFKQVQRTTLLGPGIDVFGGGWFDDGDGIPEVGDDFLIGCNGGGFHNLGLKPVPVTPRSARQEARERFGG